ncbi:RsmB/NOP family class I SAM-dependent RNA methyltransferase [Methylovorus glucosotrophus]|uniref:Fmu (Sun) domain protein n=1 Tax=Methylovorus glucosotrophus (strain SIP3-4) TaxID=582744 RepID=C6X8K3_METGS|nr:RsmB/NOP family class I SAM-dependent RNA methyltransferase [Methylovorus glucosotrophus]ACT49473.1 Fmu (Sun) domain protein [Methylovorus glucosotrophus SIP3-4]
MKNIHPQLLRFAGTALADILAGTGPADAVLGSFFRNNRELGTKERAFVAESVYGVLRRKRLLSYLADGDDPRKLLVAWLVRVQGMSLRDLEDTLNTQQKEWAQEIKAKNTDNLSLAIQADMPDWLWEKLSAQYGDEQALTIARSMQQQAMMDLRVNTIKATREDVLAKFISENTQLNQDTIVPTPLSPTGIRLPQRLNISRHILFTEGKVEVQDEGSQLLAHLVAPRRGEMIADLCAGAGGKTLAMGALMRNTGRLYAFDISEKRLTNLGQRLKRSGLSNLHSQLISSEQDAKLKRLNGKFNRVLVDAPCSGLGTLRRNPDLKWRQTPQDVLELKGKQTSILARAAKLVKAGGRLIYATCSLLSDENEAIADAFLAAHPDFKLIPANEVLAQQQIPVDTGEYLKLLPHLHQTDGFFAAVFEKAAASSEPAAA